MDAPPWPVTITTNPCAGEVPWLAFACEPWELGPELLSSCAVWEHRRQRARIVVGEGYTPNEALHDLICKLQQRDA